MNVKLTLSTLSVIALSAAASASPPPPSCPPVRTVAAANPVAAPVCESYVGTGCYWMENTSGNYCWVPSPWTPSFQDCFAADSCDGGLGQSGGGCYKWAAGSDAPRTSWRRGGRADLTKARAVPVRRLRAVRLLAGAR